MLLLAVLLLGCGEEDDTDDTTWDPDLATHIDQGYRLEAQLDAGTSLTGWEEYHSTEPQAQQTICRYRWDVTGTPGTPCPECAWAFDVTYANGRAEEGDCESMWARDDAVTAWGWAESVDMGGYTWEDVVMVNYSGTGWYAWSYGTYSGGVVAAEYIESYIYY